MALQKDTVIKKCDRYLELKKQIDELSYELESIKEDLKKDLEDRGLDEFVVGPYSISNKSVTTSRFNSKAFKEKYESLYESFSSDAVSTRFLIKY